MSSRGLIGHSRDRERSSKQGWRKRSKQEQLESGTKDLRCKFRVVANISLQSAGLAGAGAACLQGGQQRRANERSGVVTQAAAAGRWVPMHECHGTGRGSTARTARTALSAHSAHSARPVAPASGRAARFCRSSSSSEEVRLSSSSLPGLESAGEPSSSRLASSTSSAGRDTSEGRKSAEGETAIEVQAVLQQATPRGGMGSARIGGGGVAAAAAGAQLPTSDAHREGRSASRRGAPQ